ncbi:MAG: DGQHR domain-containing protein [Nitrososphaerota archaeon]|nr:DGQHR domain-containing protein [Nitrososphaerota archaeon]
MKVNTKAYPVRVPALVVKQPLGEFYVIQLPACVLLDTAYSDRLEAIRVDDGSYKLDGSQRQLTEPRLKQIGQYIGTVESAFPNSIILAANFRHEDGLFEEDTENQWKLEMMSRDGAAMITIPKPLKLAAIIDGQHRLFGFRFAPKDRLDFPLVCSVYFGLPKPFQAFLFATINSTQKAVDKSQTYELFGYNVEEEPPDAWTPDKLAVFLSRKLNTEKDSPLEGRIMIAAENEIVDTRSEAHKLGRWMVSMAAVVEGIVSLISANPKADSYHMHEYRILAGRKRSLLTSSKSGNKTPLRRVYIENNDKLIYTLIKNYLTATDLGLWRKASPKSYIHKTVGIQASFDVLRELALEAIEMKDVSVEFFNKKLLPAIKVRFEDDFFSQASGTGRVRIRNALELCLRLKRVEDLSEEDRGKYMKICDPLV